MRDILATLLFILILYFTLFVILTNFRWFTYELSRHINKKIANNMGNRHDHKNKTTKTQENSIKNIWIQ